MARKMKTMDGNNAAWVAYPFRMLLLSSQSPSSVMAEVTDAGQQRDKLIFSDKQSC